MDCQNISEFMKTLTWKINRLIIDLYMNNHIHISRCSEFIIFREKSCKIALRPHYAH